MRNAKRGIYYEKESLLCTYNQGVKAKIDHETFCMELKRKFYEGVIK